MSRDSNNVLQFPAVSGAYAAGRSMPNNVSDDEFYAFAWSNYFRDEIRKSPHAVALDRADEFVADLKRMNERFIQERVHGIMEHG